VRRDARHHSLDERFVLTGALVGDALARRWAAADLLVLPSRKETYGMVVTEALSRGIPVIASDVGGVPEALGAAPGGAQPGLLVPPGDVTPLAGALRLWLSDAGRRDALREAARERRTSLASWADTADRVGHVLREVAA
jgi:glycosyltransferase involved in cell wall biosynthesis